MSQPGETPDTPGPLEQDGSIPETVIPDNAKDPPEPEPEPEPEPDTEEPDEDVEAEYVEDDANAANDVRRRLWRLQSALKIIEPTPINIQVVGSVLWRMSVSDPVRGEHTWMEWLTGQKYEKEKAREHWDDGFEKAPFYPVEVIYRAAQRAGWRYPIARNLNKLEEMVERTEKALVRAGAEIYQNRDRLV